VQRILKLDRTKIMSIINRLAFFDKFSILEKHKMLAFHTQFFIYQSGEIIIEEGCYDSEFFILLDGSVDVIKTSNPVPLDTLEPGDFFGEISFLTGSPRTANVIASTRSIAIQIDHRMMKRLEPEIREKIKDQIIYKLTKCLTRMNEAHVQ